MLKKFLLSFFAFWVFAMSFLPSVTYAQSQNGTWYNQSFQEWYKKVNDSPSDEIFGERYTAAQVQWVIYGLFYFILNGSTNGNGSAISCLMTKEVSKCKNELEKLLPKNPIISHSSDKTLLASVFENRSLSFVTYLKNSANDLRLIPSASAQQITGFGFNALNPALGLWKTFRNMAYAVFVFVIIAFAFMIMFRVKISPQAVITVQSSLPKIAITLILITFSYAIAGLMVDFMYIIFGIISIFFSTAVGGYFSPVDLFNFFTKGSIGPVPVGILGILIIYLLLFTTVLAYVLMFGNGIVGFITENLFTLGASTAAFSILTLIISILLLVVFIISAIKIVWMLFKTYANILLLTIFAPLQIAVGAVVNSGGFGGWAKSLISNLAVFPVVSSLFFVSYLFLLQTVQFVFGNYLPSSWNSVLSQLPLSRDFANYNGWPPLLGVDTRMTALILLVTSLVIITIIPKTVQLIQGMITGKGFEYGTAIGEAVGPVAKPIVGFAGPVINQGRAGLTLKGVEHVAGKLKVNQSSFYKENILPGLQKQAGVEKKER